MITLVEVGKLFQRAEMGGCKAPPAMATNLMDALTMWAEDLTEAGLDYGAASAALGAYMREPQADGFPKPFPTVGHLVARTPAFRARKQIEAGADGYFDTALATRASLGDNATRGGEEGDVFLASGQSEAVEDAVWAGVKACGGWDLFGKVNPARCDVPRRAFRTAFLAALTDAPMPMLLTAADAPRLGQQSRDGK